MTTTELDAHVQRLVDQAPPFTAEQKDKLRFLLSAAPRHDEGAARQPRQRPLNATPPAAKLVGGCDARR
jgi:hypothetical protein